MWVLLILLFFSSNKLHAQETLLSGVVKTADGTPLEGVTVWQQNNDNGTQTNEQGFYTLSISPNAVIVFEYIGYKTQTVKASGSILNVTLTADDYTLEELVINAGYYSVKDKERTGSISKITSKEIGQQPVANPLAAMQGRMAGVNITQSSGTPGGGFDIQIRGRNSLRTEGNAPLYIVDGVPFLSESTSHTNLSAGILRSTANNPLQLINPNDIESIEVLKDADATAIYGSRGANGVVLITTKKGSNQPAVFTLSSVTTIAKVGRFMKMLNTPEYLELRKRALANDGIMEYPAFEYDVNGTWDQNRYTDWQKELIGGKAESRQTNAGVRGGDRYNQFMLQIGSAEDGTVFPGDYGNKRKNLMAQFAHTTSDDRWKIQTQFIRGESNNRLLGTDLTREALMLAPNAPALYNADGSLNWENSTWNNPLRWQNQKYTAKNTQWLNSWNIEGTLSNALKVKLQAGYSENTGSEKLVILHTINKPSFGLTSSSTSHQLNESKGSNWSLEPQLQFFKVWDVHKLDILAGTTFLKQQHEQKVWKGTNFSSNTQADNLRAAKILQILADVETHYAYQALFARLNYQYREKYILNITGRRDGSSRFGPGRQWGNFGAVGAAWLFGREEFLSGASWLSFGKLRASIGTTGNDRIGDYQYLDTYANSGGMYQVGGLAPARLFNPDFSWETNRKQEVALELALFNNRLNISSSYYSNTSSNQLVGIPLPGTTGFASVQANLPATVRNAGFEFEMKANLLSSADWSWEIGGNINFNRNKLLEFPDLEASTYKNMYAVGYPTTIQYVYEYTGIDPQTGLYTFKDFNNDGKITPAEDRMLKVDLTPQFFGGIYQSLAYRNFSISMLLQGVKQKGANYLLGWGMPGGASNLPADFQEEAAQEVSSGYNDAAYTAFDRYKASQAAYSDASYIRLKNVVLTYRFETIGKNKLSGSVYCSGQNLLTFTNYRGLDPESLSTSVLPPLKSWSFGVILNY
ncbi:MAG: SusC/RagA family TonB-linked outer membrane protein [Myroides sp.]